jgi:hypothetical protein
MVTDKVVVESINRKLAEEYRVLDGRPIYRLVWSDDLVEKRVGTFTDWYGHIMIRQEHRALREVKKYWYLNPPCYVFEKLVFMPREKDMQEIIEELVEARNGSYEPIYSFRKEDGTQLPVIWPVVERMLMVLHNPVKKLPSDFAADQLLEEQAEHDYFYNEISKDERPELFVWENSSFVSTNQLKFKQEYTEKLKPIEGVSNAIVCTDS